MSGAGAAPAALAAAAAAPAALPGRGLSGWRCIAADLPAFAHPSHAKRWPLDPDSTSGSYSDTQPQTQHSSPTTFNLQPKTVFQIPLRIPGDVPKMYPCVMVQVS